MKDDDGYTGNGNWDIPKQDFSIWALLKKLFGRPDGK